MIKVKEDMTGWEMWKHGVPESRLTVIQQTEDYVSPSGEHKSQWLCECGCDAHTIIKATGNAIRRGNTKSCGCLQKEEAARIGRGLKKGNQYHLNMTDEYGLYGIGYCSNTGNVFYFDMEDYDKIKNYTWSEAITKNGYHVLHAYDPNSKTTIRMHHLIADKYYDHHDRNPLNNRKYNLWEATIQENVRNASKRKDNKSGFIGVQWHKRQQNWHARIRVNGKLLHLGSFINKQDALIARLHAEFKYFGPDFAPQRHLFEQYQVSS